MTAHKLISPCKSCFMEFEDKNLCALDCNELERYNAFMEHRPPVDLAEKKRRDAKEFKALQVAGLKRGTSGPRKPRVTITPEKFMIALEARRQGATLKAAAELIGVGRKYLAKRFQEAGVSTERSFCSWLK